MKTRSSAVPLPSLQMALHLQVGDFIYRYQSGIAFHQEHYYL